jgi:hypothetical protein
MKKIGIVAENRIEFNRFIEYELKLNPNSNDVKNKYRYLNFYDYECVSGIELSEFIFASDRLRDMYHFFKKIESRVRK